MTDELRAVLMRRSEWRFLVGALEDLCGLSSDASVREALRGIMAVVVEQVKLQEKGETK